MQCAERSCPYPAMSEQIRCRFHRQVFSLPVSLEVASREASKEFEYFEVSVAGYFPSQRKGRCVTWPYRYFRAEADRVGGTQSYDRKEMLEMQRLIGLERDRGLSTYQISRELSISLGTVRKYLGYPPRLGPRVEGSRIIAGPKKPCAVCGREYQPKPCQYKGGGGGYICNFCILDKAATAERVRTRRARAEQLRAAIPALVAQGLSAKRIAETLQTSKTTVLRYGVSAP